MTNYDIVVLGGGPGGYVSAIRSAQLGNKTAIIDHDRLGGICLNWGCIPTKALLKNAEILHYVKNSSQFGINISKFNIDFTQTVKRSREVSHRLSKGIEFLIKKNKIKHIDGTGVLKSKSEISVLKGDKKQKIKAKKIIIATGGRPKEFPGIKYDGKRLITSKEAMTLKTIPKKLIIIGAGAIGVEFAYFYNEYGSEVHLIEMMSNILPIEDEDLSKELETNFEKAGINIYKNSKVSKIQKLQKSVKVHINEGAASKIIEADIVLVATGVTGNTTVTAGTALNLTGTAYNSDGSQSYNGGGNTINLTNAGGATFTTSGDAISFSNNGNIALTGDLTVAVSSGTVTVDGNITGNGAANSAVDIQTAAGSNIILNDITAVGQVNLATSGAGQINFDAIDSDNNAGVTISNGTGQILAGGAITTDGGVITITSSGTVQLSGNLDSTQGGAAGGAISFAGAGGI